MTVQRAFRLSNALDQQFCEIAEKLGTSPADVLRMFTAAFVAYRGFPFAVRLPPQGFEIQPPENKPEIITPLIRNGHAVLPASWREDDAYDD